MFQIRKSGWGHQVDRGGDRWGRWVESRTGTGVKNTQGWNEVGVGGGARGTSSGSSKYSVWKSPLGLVTDRWGGCAVW
eukprot:766376-Hanusia_phi.AAC.8